MWKDTKYLLAYIAPLAALGGIHLGGIWSFGAIYIAFIIIPVLEFFMPNSPVNLSVQEEGKKKNAPFYDVLLYLNLPLLYILLGVYFSTLSAGGLQPFEVLGMTLSVGIIVGSLGINVGHELGHRPGWLDQLVSKALLLPALYMHFNIEHNRGHHKNVATDEDPASARFGENIYAFWCRSVMGSYRNAWKLENDRLQRKGEWPLSWKNEMIWFHLIQLTYLLAVGFTFGWIMIVAAIFIAVNGFLLLESVNYIEHYGLRRYKLPSGRYEPISPRHSWNSDHELGRIFLYELTRHSDHHYKASRKYQLLRHFPASPQLPCGYPAAILSSLVPPLWFRLMNKRVIALASSKREESLSPI